MISCPKETYYRSPRLLKLANEAPECMACGRPKDGTIVAAHSNAQRHGKGMGIKAHDIPAFVCSRCHDEIDGRHGTFNKFERERMWMDAMFNSLVWLLMEGHLVAM